MGDTGLADVAELDHATGAAAAALLRPCCASTRWAQLLVRGRPHGSLGQLLAASDAAIAVLGWPDICEALTAHPRIGDRAAGPARESAWSRQEQAAAGATTAAPGGEVVAAGLRAGNEAYEERFGYVFLVCAAGRPAEQILAALRGRLGHSPEAEQEVVREELRQIARLRLAKTFR
jgi:2-oxo-4-hydroxy-4-carboxy-5-ureidoimidazoline decarboxylase